MKNTILVIKAIILLIAFAIILPSCASDKLPEPQPPEFCETVEVTYDNQIKPIIDSSCAYSACHDGSGITGAPGIFATYGGMQPFFATSFRTRVLDLTDDPSLGMPPNMSVYIQSQKDDLTQEELDLMDCWISSGFPEK